MIFLRHIMKKEGLEKAANNPLNKLVEINGVRRTRGGNEKTKLKRA